MDLVAEQQSSDFIEMLGELRIKGALSDREFQRLKSLVLDTNEHGLSKDLLSLLEKFWGQRTKSYLTDDDFKKKKGRLLHDFLNEEELEPASPDPSTDQASKRKVNHFLFRGAVRQPDIYSSKPGPMNNFS